MHEEVRILKEKLKKMPLCLSIVDRMNTYILGCIDRDYTIKKRLEEQGKDTRYANYRIALGEYALGLRAEHPSLLSNNKFPDDFQPDPQPNIFHESFKNSDYK